MASKRPHWDTYNKEMSQFNFGHALWEPGPLTYFKRIQLGDVGYIYAGRFRLLFSAGCPLGKRRRGIDVPHTFKPLEAGEIDDREPLPAGYLGTSGVQVTGALPRPASSTPSISPTSVQPRPPSSPPMSETASTISFQLTGGQGAVLLTKYSTYREDTLRGGAFEKYAKEHYNSWVAFAREAGHGDVNPVIVTGVDRTKDFAMLCYSNDDDDLRCEFTASAPGTTTDWGSWQKTGLVYTNHGPQPRRPSSVQTENLTSSGNDNTELVSDEYNQSVFIRYFTMRKRLGVPRIVKAGAGPHDLGRRGRDDDESSLEAPYSSDTESDSETSLFDSDGEDDGCSVTSAETESDILVHNVTADGRDDFDVVADYIFENSDAESVLLHHRDIALILERGDGADLATLLFERSPAITVDSRGVGMIESRAVSPAETQLDWVTTPTLQSTPSEGGQDTTNEGGLSKPPLPSTKKALLVGISYVNQTEGGEGFEPIPTSIPNVRKFKQFLQDHHGYTDITVMTDEDGVEESLQPTAHNLEREIKALSYGAKPGDRRVFYFSGHSDQLPCKTGSEEDGMDEALVALNGTKIRDNNLHKWLVKALPQGSALTAIFDCCHSGTLLDLPHYKCNNVYQPWVNREKRASNTHSFVSLLGEEAGRHQRCASPERQFECDGWCRKTMQTEGSLPHADVISISSSNDGQISYDASTSNGDSLSMTSFLIGILKKDQKLTYSQLMMQLNNEICSFTRGMHSSVHRRRSARRNTRGKNRNPEGAEPEEDKGEMDNFQDLQLGSLTPLNMDRLFAL